ncbi:MAG: hypothetical protein A2V93_07350 [Ignavibacteria bacterium RBG_16_34_14]|nr:MAG: hypothetical protein A2V93_07350 [Ignavibacteria bacterium RBG_16_34_14]
MKVLFIGGTGRISSACSQLAVEQGIELFILNRELTLERLAPKEVKILMGNIYNTSSAQKL